MDILTEITERRLADIEKKGFTLGHNIPEKRLCPVVPFLPEQGTILEIKRASPSKGMISPDLDAVETAKKYISAGTSAISVLTEENYFHGSLEDLQAVANISGRKASVLRKDFLLEVEEVEVAYKCGADAVLLIARILETEKLLQMAEKAFELGISVLLEVREDSDLEKAFVVLEKAHSVNADKQIVLGINSRDLATFTIDLLIPLKLKERILKLYEQKKADLLAPRIISESGVTSGQAAEFVGNLGFHGVLIGEAAARNPEKAKDLVSNFVSGAKAEHKLNEYGFWQKYVKLLESKKTRPLVKICGLREKEDALKAFESGADLLGFIFAEKSKRTNSLTEETVEKLKNIRDYINQNKKGEVAPLMLGVIVESESKEGIFAKQLVEQGILDGIQFHGCADSAEGSFGYAAVPVAEENDLEQLKVLYSKGFARILIDAKNVNAQNAEGDVRYGGTGCSIPEAVVKSSKKLGTLCLSGGINADNVKAMITAFEPELIDVASGIESEPGKKDYTKMELLFKNINR